jgi:hypothetical protein
MATMQRPTLPTISTPRVSRTPNPRKKAIWEWKIVRRAILDALLKLSPRKMMGNPVMFVVEIGSVITTALLFKSSGAFKFNLQITLWLWFTVLFANFAEAMAEGHLPPNPGQYHTRFDEPSPEFMEEKRRVTVR